MLRQQRRGVLLVGVTADGQIVGVGDVDRVMLDLHGAVTQHCRPPVTVVAETAQTEEGVVVVARVPRGSQRPYATADGRYYVRSGTR